ncbi:MAG: hypothetical protein RR387_08155, partial [Clostridiales bacterium]
MALNAFAAAWEPDDAVIVVSMGALEYLSRDELKAQLIRTFMTGVEKAWVQRKAEEYCQAYWNK